MTISGNNSQFDKIKSYHIPESIIANATFGGIMGATIPATIGIAKQAKRIGNLPADKIELLHKTAEQAIKDTGLAAKGVNIQYLKEPAIKSKKFFPIKNIIKQIKLGFNAAYCPLGIPNKVRANTILMPEKGVPFLAFHEIGHAMNFNLSKASKALYYVARYAPQIAPLIALYGILTTKSENKDGKELTKGQKINNFIRNNAGKLAFGAMVPQLIEEGLATIKGQKLANKMLSPELAKTVLKGNATCYLTYLLGAIGIGVGSWAAVKIKDKLVEKVQN